MLNENAQAPAASTTVVTTGVVSCHSQFETALLADTDCARPKLPNAGPRNATASLESSASANEPLAQLKHCNKLPQILARAEAEQAAAAEALLTNTDGEVVEAAAGDLFWI